MKTRHSLWLIGLSLVGVLVGNGCTHATRFADRWDDPPPVIGPPEEYPLLMPLSVPNGEAMGCCPVTDRSSMQMPIGGGVKRGQRPSNLFAMEPFEFEAFLAEQSVRSQESEPAGSAVVASHMEPQADSPPQEPKLIQQAGAANPSANSCLPCPCPNDDLLEALVGRVEALERDLKASQKQVTELQQALTQSQQSIHALNADVKFWRGELGKLESVMHQQHESDIQALDAITETLTSIMEPITDSLPNAENRED